MMARLGQTDTGSTSTISSVTNPAALCAAGGAGEFFSLQPFPMVDDDADSDGAADCYNMAVKPLPAPPGRDSAAAAERRPRPPSPPAAQIQSPKPSHNPTPAMTGSLPRADSTAAAMTASYSESAGPVRAPLLDLTADQEALLAGLVARAVSAMALPAQPANRAKAEMRSDGSK
jgi:hypothetical protein